MRRRVPTKRARVLDKSALYSRHARRKSIHTNGRSCYPPLSSEFLAQALARHNPPLADLTGRFVQSDRNAVHN